MIRIISDHLLQILSQLFYHFCLIFLLEINFFLCSIQLLHWNSSYGTSLNPIHFIWYTLGQKSQQINSPNLPHFPHTDYEEVFEFES
jgi:hypothetical protein